MTPSGLALGPDGKRLYVVCSDANVVAVVDISRERSHVEGFIPTGWYPTAARVLPAGTLVVLNGRGLRLAPESQRTESHAPAGSQSRGRRAAVEYVGRIQTGTASFIEPFTDEQLAGLYQDRHRQLALSRREAGNAQPVPAHPARHLHRQGKPHVRPGAGRYEGGQRRSLAGAVRRKGHAQRAQAGAPVRAARQLLCERRRERRRPHWSTAAIATDYIQKMWPNSYASRRKNYDYEEQEPTDAPPAGYLWTSAAGAGLSMRNYGYMAQNRAQAARRTATQIEAVRDPVLNRVTNRLYRDFDLDYPDVERVKVFLADLAEFEKSGQMPRLMFMRLGNDHTNGTQAGKLSPLSLAADNDYALGMLVEAVSKSRFWASTAIFVLEDDAQNGPDHVDSHRSPAFRDLALREAPGGGQLDVQHHVDAAHHGADAGAAADDAVRRRRAAHVRRLPATADPAPYVAEKPRVPLDERNPAHSPTAERSARLDFSEEDRADDDELNDILWLAIKGTHPPPPARSFFAR